MDAEGLVDELRMRGPHTDEETVSAILATGDEAFPHLARLATHKESWNGDVPWAPPCAVHLLATMKHYRAQLAISAALLECHEYFDDWLTEDMPHALAHMGVGAIPTLASVMAHSATDDYVRSGAARALAMIATRHPESKPGIVGSIRQAARDEGDISMRTMLVDSLLDLRDPGLYGYLRDSLESGFITPDFFDLNTLDSVYAKGSDRLERRPRDPLYVFSYRDDHPYKGMWHTEEEQEAAKPPPVVPGAGKAGRPPPPVGPKPRRGDPCPCGSGKRYKKCCLRMVEA